MSESQEDAFRMYLADADSVRGADREDLDNAEAPEAQSSMADTKRGAE